MAVLAISIRTMYPVLGEYEFTIYRELMLLLQFGEDSEEGQVRITLSKITEILTLYLLWLKTENLTCS